MGTIALLACTRGSSRSSAPPSADHTTPVAVSELLTGSGAGDVSFDREAAVLPQVTDLRPRPEPRTRTIVFGDERSAMLVLPRSEDGPARLLVMIHGVCTPPSYVCGAWAGTAADNGLLVCPVGNTTCGPEGTGPPTWEESFAAIDDDVEQSIKAATRQAPRFTREGAVLAGYSRGGYAAVILAVRHPGRWPFLILNEADVDLTPEMARAAGVRAVALIAGEWGNQIAGEEKTRDALIAAGFPVRLWTMPKAGHFYSPDIADIMKEALLFVLSHDG